VETNHESSGGAISSCCLMVTITSCEMTLTSEIEYLDDILDRSPPAEGRLEYGGGGAASHIICGGFAIEDPAMSLFLEDLPRVLHVESRDEAAGVDRTGSGHPGGSVGQLRGSPSASTCRDQPSQNGFAT
jgi:hypothetical protein